MNEEEKQIEYDSKLDDLESKSPKQNREVEDEFKESKLRKFSKKVDDFIIRNTPDFIKRFLSWLISFLPSKVENWIRNNRFLTICIIYTIRGLFFRPSMWALYAAIGAWFAIK